MGWQTHQSVTEESDKVVGGIHLFQNYMFKMWWECRASQSDIWCDTDYRYILVTCTQKPLRQSSAPGRNWKLIKRKTEQRHRQNKVELYQPIIMKCILAHLSEQSDKVVGGVHLFQNYVMRVQTFTVSDMMWYRVHTCDMHSNYSLILTRSLSYCSQPSLYVCTSLCVARSVVEFRHTASVIIHSVGYVAVEVPRCLLG